MLKRSLAFAALTAALIVPAQSGAEVGSVISSFRATPAQGFAIAWACYREADYVYVFCGGPPYIRKYTPDGTLLSSFAVPGFTWPKGADRTHLGAGYIGVCNQQDPNQFYIIDLASGSFVSSFIVYTAPLDYFFDGTYYYFKSFSTNGWFTRHKTTGEYVDNVNYAGYPPGGNYWFGGAGFTTRFNGAAGAYTIIDFWSPSEAAAFTTPDGSLVAAWHSLDAGYGSACGPGAPASYGITFWAINCKYVPPGDEMWVVQYDIGGAVPAVLPSSLGKIKAIYR